MVAGIVVSVRVTGTEGMRFDGEIGRGSRATYRDGSGEEGNVPERYEVWGVKGMVPEEYEIPVGLASELALASFVRDVATNEVDGGLKVELIHDGRVVGRVEGSGKEDAPVGTSWPVPEKTQ